MKNGIQTFMKGMGNEACFFICLLETTYRLYKQKHPNGVLIKPVEDYTIGELMSLVTAISFDKKHNMDFNVSNYEDSNNYFVLDSPALIKYVYNRLAGEQVEVGYTKVISSKDIPSNSVVIEEWKWKQQHFRFANEDSLQASQTVRNGSIVSYRCYFLK